MLAALVGAGILLLLYRDVNRQPPPQITSAPETLVKPMETNRVTRDGHRIFRSRRTEMTKQQKEALKATFKEKLKPALQNWSKAYNGHIPFGSDDVTPDSFVEQMGRGTYCRYVFVIDGVTLGIEDLHGSVHVSYMNAPASKHLMQLPHGTPPNPELPVARSDLAKMLKEDSGKDFAPADIRIVPTGFSSAMNGGANVSVGGDPVNIASWNFTLSFGPDGDLVYYSRGKE